MRKRDGRKLDHKTLEEIRIRAVERVEAGESPEVVIRALGFERTRIYHWLAAYREGGIGALKAKPLSGRPPKLTAPMLKRLYDIVTSKNPQQLKFAYALWTRGMVRELIRERFGVRLSEVSVGRLLKKLGLSPQRPLTRAYEQDPKAVARWLREDYPRIKQLAKKHKARLYFADESAVRSDFHRGTSWAPRGKTPVVAKSGTRRRLNLISAISPKGELRFMVRPGRLTAPAFIEFLKRLGYRAKRPLCLIVDNHPVHRAAKVKRFVASTHGRLRLFYLPPYSPELNPDELVWNHLKTHHVGRALSRNLDELRKAVHRVLRSMQKTPSLIRSFFNAPTTRYTQA